MSYGYVYVLIHPSHPKLVVVSSATTDPEDPARSDELAPFVVIYSRQTPAESEVLKLIMRLMSHYGHDVASNPNYFSCTPTTAIRILMTSCDEVAKQIAEQIGGSAPDVGSTTETTEEDSSSEADTLYYAGSAAAIGSGDAIEDHHEALRLFEQAAKKGCVRAYDDMGELYYTSETVHSERRAIEAWKEGAQLGSAGCWAQLAKHYEKEGHSDNAKKCWGRFFTLLAPMDAVGLSEVVLHVGKALEDHSASFFDPLYLYALKPHRDNLIIQLDATVAMCKERNFTHGLAASTRARELLRVLVGK